MDWVVYIFFGKFTIFTLIGSKATQFFCSSNNLRNFWDSPMKYNLLRSHFILVLCVSNFCFIELPQNFCNWLQLFFDNKNHEFVRVSWIKSFFNEHETFLSNERGIFLSNEHGTFWNIFNLTFWVSTIFKDIVLKYYFLNFF